MTDESHHRRRTLINLAFSLVALALAAWMTFNVGANLMIEHLPGNTFRISDRRVMTRNELRWSLFLSTLTVATKVFISILGIVTASRILLQHKHTMQLPHYMGYFLPFISVVALLGGQICFAYGYNRRTDWDKETFEMRSKGLLMLSPLLYIVGIASAVAFGMSSKLPCQ